MESQGPNVELDFLNPLIPVERRDIWFGEEEWVYRVGFGIISILQLERSVIKLPRN
jgi:hypothetical protein